MSVTGEHNWYWFPLNDQTYGATMEVAERCHYCELFAGTENKLFYRNSAVEVPQEEKKE